MSTAVRYFDPESLRIWLPEGGSRLRIEIKDECTILSAIVRQAFPQSEAGGYLSIQHENGQEVGILKSTDGLDAKAKDLIQRELDRRYYTPNILGISALRQEAGMWFFAVETQRGPTTFYVRNWRDSSHEIQPGRLQILSVDGQRFGIEDWSALDARSQTLLEQLG